MCNKEELDEFIHSLPPSQRLTKWEAKQLISAEVYEYAADKSTYEANDIFGNARYLGMPLFLDGLDLLIRKNLGIFLTVKHAWTLLTSDPDIKCEFIAPHPRIANFEFAVLDQANKALITKFIEAAERFWISQSKREIEGAIMDAHYPKIMT